MSLNRSLYQAYVDEFGMLRFAQSMTRLAVRLLGACAPFELTEDKEADELPEVVYGSCQKERKATGRCLRCGWE